MRYNQPYPKTIVSETNQTCPKALLKDTTSLTISQTPREAPLFSPHLGISYTLQATKKQHVILFKHISNLSFLRISCKSSPFLRFRRLVDSNDHGMLSLYTTRKCTKSGQAIKGKDPSEKTHHL